MRKEEGRGQRTQEERNRRKGRKEGKKDETRE